MPRGRENSRVRIGASAIRPLEYFPYGLASPARADCIGVPRGHGWVREASMAICKSWGEGPPKVAVKERKILPQPPFMVVRYLRNLAVLLNYRSQRSLIFTPNKHPRGTPILIGAGWRSHAKGEK